MCAQLLQSCPTLCDPMDYGPPGFSVHRILQIRVLEWVAMPSPGDLPYPGIKSMSPKFPALAGGFFTTSTTWEAHKKAISLAKYLLTWQALGKECANFFFSAAIYRWSVSECLPVS